MYKYNGVYLLVSSSDATSSHEISSIQNTNTVNCVGRSSVECSLGTRSLFILCHPCRMKGNGDGHCLLVFALSGKASRLTEAGLGPHFDGHENIENSVCFKKKSTLSRSRKFGVTADSLKLWERVPSVDAIWKETAAQAEIGSIVWALKPRSREMSARGDALHGVCLQRSLRPSTCVSSCWEWDIDARMSRTSISQKFIFVRWVFIRVFIIRVSPNDKCWLRTWLLYTSGLMRDQNFCMRINILRCVYIMQFLCLTHTAYMR